MKTIYIPILILSSTLLSCTENINYSDLNIQYVDRIVVDGTITTEPKEQTVLLYHSNDISKTDSSLMETEAVVSITDGDTILHLIEKQKGVYVTDISYAARVKKTYSLNIKLKNGEEYTASSYLYPAMTIDTMYSALNGEYYDIYIKAHSHWQQGAAVIMDLYANDSILTANLKNKIIYAMGSFYEKVLSISASQFTKDTSYVQLCMYSISYQKYEYLNDIRNETIWSTEIFRTTPANVRTNISNGGLGFFSASDVCKKKIAVIKK
jgi:hypothetical protein